MGWEQIEEDENLLPFGFKWDRNVTYTRTFSNIISFALNQWILKVHFAKPGANSGWNWLDPTTVDYVKVSTNEYPIVNTNIDYTKISSVSGATSTTEGLNNTYNLFTASGQSAFDGEAYLIENGYEVRGTPSGSLERPSNYAALYAVKKNKFQVEEVSNDPTGSPSSNKSYALNISQSDIKWYLPAIGQFGSVPGSMNSSSRQYWSSTANNDGSTAQAWNGSPTTPRMNNNYVRAVRVKE